MALMTRSINRFKTEIDTFRHPTCFDARDSECTCGSCPEMNPSLIKKNITYLYHKGTNNLGSIQMRIPQSANCIKFLNSHIGVRGICLESRLTSQIKNEIIVLSKFAAVKISRIDLEKLMENDNSVYIDPVDAEINLEKFLDIKGLIASSFLQEQYFKQNSDVPVILMYHSSDFRLKGIQAQKDYYSMAYFGSLSRLPHSPELLPFLEIVKTPLSYQPNTKLPIFSDKLKDFSAHFAIGAELPRYVFKPFTKGLIASSVGAITLISRNEKEALLLLGDDYPYVSIDSSLKSISDMAKFMKLTFGGDEWNKAQMSHQKFVNFTCPKFHALNWSKILV